MITNKVWASLSWLERLGGIVGGIVLLGALYGAVKAGLQVPSKLDAHIMQADSIISNQREQIRLQRVGNCIAIHVRAEDKLACEETP